MADHVVRLFVRRRDDPHAGGAIREDVAAHGRKARMGRPVDCRLNAASCYRRGRLRHGRRWRRQ
jgi:hypothetical protein